MATGKVDDATGADSSARTLGAHDIKTNKTDTNDTTRFISFLQTPPIREQKFIQKQSTCQNSTLYDFQESLIYFFLYGLR